MVLLLTDDLDVGGVQRIVVQLSCLLSQRGYQVGVAAAGGKLWAQVPSTVSRFVRSGNSVWQLAFLGWRLRRMASSGELGIVHAHQRRVALLARIMTLGTTTKVVEHVHNVFRPDLFRFLSFRGAQLIACGPAIEQMLIEKFGRPRDRVNLVPNSVADLGSGIDLRLPFSLGAKLPTLINVARLSEQKDPERFVEIVHELNRDGQRVRAIWIGDGPLRDTAERKASSLGVVGLHFPGSSNEVERSLLAADVMLMTSRWEGLPLALLEAMALGRGVISTDVGSCRDAVIEGANGFLYSAEASSSLVASRIVQNLNAETLARWGSSSRALYERLYEPETMINRIEEVYQKALGESTPLSHRDSK